MNPIRSTRSLGLATLALALCAARHHSQDERASLDAIWNDPSFQKSFIGGYGINAEIEPRLAPDEITMLDKLRPLIAENPAKAEEALRKAMKPESSATLDYQLALLQCQQDKFTEALDNFQRAVTRFPSFRRAWRNLGILQIKRADYDASIRAFTRMIELGGADAYSYGMLGFAHTQKQDYQPAEAAYRTALLLQPDNTEWRLGMTNCVLKQGKFEDAASLLDVLIERYPDKPEFWLRQAQAFLGLKQNLHAAQNLEAVDRLGKSTVDSLQLLGDVYVTENLLDLAESAYERAIDRDPAQPVTRPLHAAEVLSSRGGNPQARALLAHLEQAAGSRIVDADRRKLLKLQARLSMADGGGTAETARVLEEIVTLDPLDGDALLLLGHYYSRQNEPDRAILYYQRAASIDAFEAQGKIFHAQILVNQARYAEALPLLRRAQEVKPREDIARYLEQVERNARAKR
jgi:tetratricopeptide (TPR) repeat protein